MNNIFKRIFRNCTGLRMFTLTGFILTLLIWPFATYAQLSPNTPFIDAQDSWAAENINLIWTDSGQEDALVNVVRWYVNWILWILWLIALVMVMYWWFLMVTAAWDSEKYWKWFTILQQWAVWLILIGTAWFIISIVFWLVNLTWTQAWPAWTW